MTTDVVIPHYGDDAMLDKCVDTFEGTDYVDQIYVVNNNVTNRGFTKACNEGIILSLKMSDAPYVSLVNNDTTFIQGKQPFQILIEKMEMDKSLGIIGPTIVAENNHDQIVHAGGLECFPNGIHKVGLISLGAHRKYSYEKWLTFAVVLIRKEALMKVGLLDERMFLIYSDSDWCFRARDWRYNCGFEPNEIWDHVGGASTGQDPKMHRLLRRDALAFFAKWRSDNLYKELNTEVMKTPPEAYQCQFTESKAGIGGESTERFTEAEVLKPEQPHKDVQPTLTVTEENIEDAGEDDGVEKIPYSSL